MTKPAGGLTLAAFITVSIAWGTTYAGMRVAVECFPPLMLAALRFSIAGAGLLVVLRAFGFALPSRREWLHATFVGLLLLTGANALIAEGEKNLPSVLASLLVNLAPLIYVALARLTGERVARRAWLGLGVGLAGMVVILLPHLRGLFGSARMSVPHFWFSAGITLLAPCLWSVGSLFAARHPARCHPFVTAAAQNVAGGIGAALLCLLGGQFHNIPHITGRAWLAFVWLLVVGSWLGYVAYIYCVMHLPSARVAITVYLNTVTALAVGVLVLGEQLSGAMLLGGALMLAGVALVQTARHSRGGGATCPPEENPHDES